MRRRLAWRLRFLADRIHPESAFGAVSYSLRFIEGKGAEVIEEGIGNKPPRGQRLWAIREEHDDAWRMS